MVSKITVPGSILEEIAHDGNWEATRKREARGTLVGFYDQGEDSIVTERRYAVVPKVASRSRKSKILDLFKLILHPSTYRSLYSVLFYQGSVVRSGEIPAEVNYHTHPSGSWSDEDLRTARLGRNAKGIKYASLLYTVDSSVFRAVNSDSHPIPIGRIEKS